MAVRWVRINRPYFVIENVLTICCLSRPPSLKIYTAAKKVYTISRKRLLSYRHLLKQLSNIIMVAHVACYMNASIILFYYLYAYISLVATCCAIASSMCEWAGLKTLQGSVLAHLEPHNDVNIA